MAGQKRSRAHLPTGMPTQARTQVPTPPETPSQATARPRNPLDIHDIRNLTVSGDASVLSPGILRALRSSLMEGPPAQQSAALIKRYAETVIEHARMNHTETLSAKRYLEALPQAAFTTSARTIELVGTCLMLAHKHDNDASYGTDRWVSILGLDTRTPETTGKSKARMMLNEIEVLFDLGGRLSRDAVGPRPPPVR